MELPALISTLRTALESDTVHLLREQIEDVHPADLATALLANLFDQVVAQLLELLGKGLGSGGAHKGLLLESPGRIDILIPNLRSCPYLAPSDGCRC